MRLALGKRLARRAFGVDDVVALKLDVIVFKLAHVAGIMQRNRCPIDETAGAHQHAVCKDAVLLRHVWRPSRRGTYGHSSVVSSVERYPSEGHG